MSSHLARRGGIWWVRLVVPARLRSLAGRREFTQSCQTHDLAIAKLVASALLVGWRRHLFNLDSCYMPLDILKLIDGSPMLAVRGWISIAEATDLSGVDQAQLLRLAAQGRLQLSCNLLPTRGRVLPVAELEYEHPELGRDGGLVMPRPNERIENAVDTVLRGNLVIPSWEVKALANAILREALSTIEVLCFDVPNQSNSVFAPDTNVFVPVQALEVQTIQVEAIRKSIAGRLTPEQIKRTNDAKAVPKHLVTSSLRIEDHMYSEAVTAYVNEPSGLPQNIVSPTEQRQRGNALRVFIEFMGDMPLGQITADTLRAFRDGPLKTIPGRANTLPKAIKKQTMPETVAAIQSANVEWPLLTTNMQHERMLWLDRMFAWLKQTKKWVAENPYDDLRGEQLGTKAERKEKSRQKDDDDEDGRPPFSAEELAMIFAQKFYETGSGAHIKKPSIWYPFEYWLPLLGLFGGLRIKEASQLYLSDVREDEKGIWYLDVNESTKDKSLKNTQSKRKVPIHPTLIQLGFVTYCQRLKSEGYKRVFPELTHSNSDAKYAKESGRKMSSMLKRLGMQRNTNKVFHCLRHNVNDAMMRVPFSVLPNADSVLRQYIRYTIMGHETGTDVNAKHYSSTSLAEMQALISGVQFDLPPITKLDVEFAVQQIRVGLKKKQGARHGIEDLGPNAVA